MESKSAFAERLEDYIETAREETDQEVLKRERKELLRWVVDLPCMKDLSCGVSF